MTERKALEVLNSWLKLAYHNADGTDEASAELYEALQTVFALITRQQSEIENLKVENQSLRGAANSLKMHYEKAQSEIDSLKIFRGYAKKRASDCRTMRDKYLNAKSEAVKEFAEKLKELDGYDNHTFDDCVSLLVSEEYKKGRYEKTNEIWSTIDNLVKEMVGENNATT